jgi:hypothetical protein
MDPINAGLQSMSLAEFKTAGDHFAMLQRNVVSKVQEDRAKKRKNEELRAMDGFKKPGPAAKNHKQMSKCHSN